MELGKPEMTLAMKDRIMRQIWQDQNMRLETWIFLDGAHAYLMLNEVEESVKAAHEFLRRWSTLRSDHALRRVYEYLQDLENAGYTDVPIVRDFREELKVAIPLLHRAELRTRYKAKERKHLERRRKRHS